jgi:hypothetical protein
VSHDPVYLEAGLGVRPAGALKGVILSMEGVDSLGQIAQAGLDQSIARDLTLGRSVVQVTSLLLAAARSQRQMGNKRSRGLARRPLPQAQPPTSD